MKFLIFTMIIGWMTSLAIIDHFGMCFGMFFVCPIMFLCGGIGVMLDGIGVDLGKPRERSFFPFN